MTKAHKKILWTIPLVVVGAFLAVASRMNTNPPTNSARTSSSDTDEEMKPSIIESEPELAAKRVSQLALSTYGRRWKFVSETQSKDEIQLVFHVPVVVFTDVLTISLRRKNAETTQVNVESHSRIGRGDFGENRRHVKQMMRAIAQAFSSSERV